jgi:hypothetical protein
MFSIDRTRSKAKVSVVVPAGIDYDYVLYGTAGSANTFLDFDATGYADSVLSEIDSDTARSDTTLISAYIGNYDTDPVALLCPISGSNADELSIQVVDWILKWNFTNT